MVRALRAAGHDVAWMLNESPLEADSSILALGQTLKRVIITFDTDFGDLVFVYNQPADEGVILCRLETTSGSAEATRILLEILPTRDSWAGASFTVNRDGRVRVRPLPVG